MQKEKHSWTKARKSVLLFLFFAMSANVILAQIRVQGTVKGKRKNDRAS